MKGMTLGQIVSSAIISIAVVGFGGTYLANEAHGAVATISGTPAANSTVYTTETIPTHY